MTQLTLWGAHEIAQMVFGRSTVMPDTWYLALIRDVEPDPFVSGMELDEPVEGGYLRVAILNDDQSWDTSLSSVMFNATEIRFAKATEDWGDIRYWAVCNAETEGYVLLWGEFAEEVYVAIDDEVVIDPGLLQMEFSAVYRDITSE